LVLPLTTWVHIAAFLSYLFSGNMLIFSLDVFFNRTMEKSNRGNSRGLFLLLGNSGWVAAPLISASLILEFSYAGTYALALVIFAFVAVTVQTGIRGGTNSSPLASPHPRLPLRAVFKQPTLRPLILANFILQFFYVWMIIYTPIYLSVILGFSWETIGTIFSVMLTAFVILDYPLGRLADWLGSEKELAAIGFLIMAVSVFALAYVPLPSPLKIGAFLFLSRIGAATVEAMTEIHFFKIITDTRMLSVFRNLRPLAYIIAPLLGVLCVTYLPFKAIFVSLGGLLIAGFFIAFHMEKNTIWWRRSHTQ
jgi:MFS family permease